MEENDGMTGGFGAPVVRNFAEPAVLEAGAKAPVFERPRAGDDGEAGAAARQEAYDAEFEWPEGKRLEPYSSSRDSLFSQLRVAVGAPDLSMCLQDTDAFGGDAARILWLCSHGPEDWSVLRSSPQALQCAIDRWEDEHIPMHLKLAASVVALRIYLASRENQHERQPTRASGSGDASGN